MGQAVFPTLAGLTWSVTKTPQFKTQIRRSVSGSELRAAFMSYPTYTFQLSYDVLREAVAYAELQNIMGFFKQRQGSYDSFLFTDPTDNSVAQQSFGTGDGAATTFQLVRNYGGYIEPIMNVNAAPSIYVNGSLQTLTTHYTISSTGLVTFVTAPGAGLSITWSGTFYYRVRFNNDSADFENFMYQLWSLKKLELYGATGNKI